jgi:hypothetical protein
MCASFDEASCGIGYAVSGSSIACSLAFFRRLCGSTSSAVAATCSFLACCPFPERTDTIELCNSCVDVQNVSFSKGFARK